MSWSHEKQLSKLTKHISGLQERKFFGRVTLDMAAGNLLRSLTEESEKYADTEDDDGEPSNEAQTDGVEDQEATAEAEPTHQEA